MFSIDGWFPGFVILDAARRRLVASVAAAALIGFGLGLTDTPASAGLVIQVENAAAQAGGTGSFDVVISATSGSFDVSAFSVELSVDPGSGIQFTDASVNTTNESYVFGTLQSAPPFAVGSLPTTDLIVADSEMTAPGYVTLAGPPTETLGLEHVTFTVAPGTPGGIVPVSIMIGPNTQILDINANSFGFDTTNGAITVSGSAVPEPSAIALGLTAAAVGLMIGRLRGKHSLRSGERV